MDREKKIAEIREALERATQGPWKWIDPGGLERKKLVGEWEIMNFGVGGSYSQSAGMEPDDNDAHLIANAPEWLRFLLDELERLEREYAEEREKMIKALKFYANEDNWRSTRFVVGRAEADSGQTAQDVLKKIGVTVE